MKKSITFFILLLFLLNVIIYYPVFLLLQSGIKNDLSRTSEKQKFSKNIKVFTVKSGDNINWEWIEKNEFRLNGIMYDVVMTETDNNSTRYYCYVDIKEMKLFEGLNYFIVGITDKENTEKKDTGNPIKEFFKDYFPAKKEYDFFIYYAEFRFKLPDIYFLSFIPEKNFPPPKIG